MVLTRLRFYWDHFFSLFGELKKDMGTRKRRKRVVANRKVKDPYGYKRFDIHRVLSAVSDIVGPLHLPGHNYVGPGTKDMSKKPKNRLDRIARRHDLAYGRAKGVKDKLKADKVMINRLERLKNKNLLEKGTLIAMKGKVAIGI